MNDETQILHDGEEKWRADGAGSVNPPIYRASLFTFETIEAFQAAMADSFNRPLYSRNFNPTVAAFEEKIAGLEQSERAIAFSSGMGAISATLLTFLGQGDHALFVNCVYGPTRSFAAILAEQFGVKVTFFAPEETLGEAADLRARLKPSTKLIYLESPGSLNFALQDIQAVTQIAPERGIVTVIDNSWASPIFQKPHKMGVDVVIHTGSKYFSGHSDLVCGVLACSEDHFKKIKSMAVLLGSNLSPADAYLALRGLRTLPLRMKQHHEGGLKVARWLESRPEVAAVNHPGLPSFELAALGRRQLSGYGSLFGFQLQAAPTAAHHAFVEALKLFAIGVSWGGFESLLLPLDFVYADDPEMRQQVGVADHQFRIFVGLENPDDLIVDLEHGFEVWRRVRGDRS
ncbi:MAG: aminotransferase class I/II-fold pyridoxal phosphate-dependent enzyme [Ardenticatenaceae bacterium]|nr:aminotransferase class I/II-fold pyridoxal phosphate-dependent enzyme [Ardenticatenaceae bacterium]